MDYDSVVEKEAVQGLIEQENSYEESSPNDEDEKVEDYNQQSPFL